MIVYPAIDLRHGRVVRLRYGDPAQETVHSDDPVATAQRWQAAGAGWLHVVNLDGALGEVDAGAGHAARHRGGGAAGPVRRRAALAG